MLNFEKLFNNTMTSPIFYCKAAHRQGYVIYDSVTAKFLGSMPNLHDVGRNCSQHIIGQYDSRRCVTLFCFIFGLEGYHVRSFS